MGAFSYIFQKERKVQQRMAKAREVSEGFSAVQSNLLILELKLVLGSDITWQLSQI